MRIDPAGAIKRLVGDHLAGASSPTSGTHRGEKALAEGACFKGAIGVLAVAAAVVAVIVSLCIGMAAFV